MHRNKIKLQKGYHDMKTKRITTRMSNGSIKYLGSDGKHYVVYPGLIYFNALEQLATFEDACEPKPLTKWHEDMSDCLFWSLPVHEPPYVGSMLDTCFDTVNEAANFTHFTQLITPIITKEDQSEYEIPIVESINIPETENEKDKYIRKIKHKIERYEKRIADYTTKIKTNSLNEHGHWSLGYFEGRKSILEDILDELEML